MNRTQIFRTRGGQLTARPTRRSNRLKSSYFATYMTCVAHGATLLQTGSAEKTGSVHKLIQCNRLAQYYRLVVILLVVILLAVVLLDVTLLGVISG